MICQLQKDSHTGCEWFEDKESLGNAEEPTVAESVAFLAQKFQTES